MRSSSSISDLRNITSTTGSTPWAWFHCASLGEYEQTAPVIESYISLHPSNPILLTFFSPSGYTPLTSTPPPSWLRDSDFITALPIDTPSKVKEFLKAANFNFKFFAAAKYEVWPELLKQLSTSSPPIPSFVFAAHITPSSSQLRPTPVGRFLHSAWTRLSGIYTQSQSSTSLLSSHGLDSIPIGDPRADRVLKNSLTLTPPDALKSWKGSSRLVIAGSTWPKEEQSLTSLLWNSDTKLIIAPHDTSPSNIARLLTLFLGKATTFSSGDFQSHIIIIDSIGLLTSIYALADLAIIGGGFSKGIHNILEPAAHSIPIITGPNTSRFREAQALSEVGGLIITSSQPELTSTIRDLLKEENSQKLSYSGQAVGYWVKEQSGSAEKIASYLP